MVRQTWIQITRGLNIQTLDTKSSKHGINSFAFLPLATESKQKVRARVVGKKCLWRCQKMESEVPHKTKTSPKEEVSANQKDGPGSISYDFNHHIDYTARKQRPFWSHPLFAMALGLLAVTAKNYVWPLSIAGGGQKAFQSNTLSDISEMIEIHTTAPQSISESLAQNLVETRLIACAQACKRSMQIES